MTVYGDVLHVQWEAPLEPNGITTGYILQIEPKRDSQSKKKLDHIVVDKIEREYYIRGMRPCKFYQVKIAVMNQNGEGRYYERRMAVSMPDSKLFLCIFGCHLMIVMQLFYQFVNYSSSVISLNILY